MSGACMRQLWRAEMYRLLAMGLDQPTADLVATLRDILPGILSDLHTQEVTHDLRMWLAEFEAQLSITPLSEWASEYNRMFVNEVFVPPSEGSYCIAERGTLLGDICGFYRAFHVHVEEKTGPPDQLKVELGFMCVLALKEAQAIHGVPDKVDVTRSAAKSFFEDHLGRWLPQFADRLGSCSSSPLIRALANVLVAWFQVECKQLLIQPTPYPTRLVAPPESPPDCPFALDASCTITHSPKETL